MRSRGLVAAAIGTAASLLIVVPASALQWAKNADGVSVVCFTPSGLTADEKAAAVLAVKDWSTVSKGLRVTWETCDPGANAVPVGLGDLGTATELGLTQYQYDPTTKEFATATITYDDEAIGSFAAALANATGKGVAEVTPIVWRAAMCHEMGHALGLERSTASDSCMQTNISSIPVQVPGAADIKQIQAYYGAGETEPTTPPAAPTTAVPTTVKPTTSTTVKPTTSTTAKPATTTTEPTTTTAPPAPGDDSEDPGAVDPGDETTVTTTPEESDGTIDPVDLPSTDVTAPAEDVDDDETTTTTAPGATTTVKPGTSDGGSGNGHETKTHHGCGTNNGDVKKWRDKVKDHKTTLGKAAKSDQAKQWQAKREARAAALKEFLAQKVAAKAEYQKKINASKTTTTVASQKKASSVGALDAATELSRKR